jgi:DNA-binding response OmpR family regulator
MTDIRSILIIDDEEALAKGMQKLLHRCGFAAHTATNGHKGLNLLKTERVDLVITDIFMDEMEGLETIVTLRRQHPQILLVAMSGGSKVVGLDCLPLAKKLGADRLLRKPVAIRTLLATIQELNGAAANAGRRLLEAESLPASESFQDTSAAS